ncbi:MAG: hypothetical protein ACI4ON_00945 [Clostridia bacterium]
MLPSEELREIISKKINIALNQYAWNDEFRDFVFGLCLDKDYEYSLNYLDEVFKYGLNIGHCGLTARYLVINIPHTDLYYGIFPPLIGTKNSPTGSHAWAVCGNYVLDTTLMLAIPIEEAKNLGYIFEKKINSNSAKCLSEYELFSNEFEHYKQEKDVFIKSLTMFK